MNTTTTLAIQQSIKNTSNPFVFRAIAGGKRSENWNADSHTIDQPLRWKKPRRIFVCAHGDLFHESVPDDWIDKVFAVMALCPQHTFQVLTKRPERAREYLKPYCHRRADGLGKAVMAMGYDGPLESLPWLLPNVWLGTSVEDQATADERIPYLQATPAAVRFISAEPLLGPMDIAPYLYIYTHEDEAILNCENFDSDHVLDFRDPATTAPEDIAMPRLDWVIVGGESGSGARPMHPEWARSLRDQCKAAGVAFFFKQWGQWLHEDQQEADGFDWSDAAERGLIHAWPDQSDSIRLHKSHAGRLLDGREWNEMPGAPI